MIEEVIDYRPETLSQQYDDDSVEEFQGEWELDELVTDLHKKWHEFDEKKELTSSAAQS